MLHALVMLAASAEGEESSKAAFYIGGGLLVAWAIVLSAFGMSRGSFPASDGQARGVMGVGVLLMVVAMVTTVVTS